METTLKADVHQNPSIDELLDGLRTGIAKHRTIIIACDCIVNYEGRANSKLELGERLIIIKSDGSVLIHRPRDYSPVNWQPPGSLFKTRKIDDSIILRVYRRKDKETMEIQISKAILFSSLDLKDTGEFTLFASEKDMQEAILFYPSLFEEGFRPIRSERQVDPGFIDIMGVDKNGILTIIEIKRKKASKESVFQTDMLSRWWAGRATSAGSPIRWRRTTRCPSPSTSTTAVRWTWSRNA